jgi:glutamate-ammonia-ligase adenylyltransferase
MLTLTHQVVLPNFQQDFDAILAQLNDDALLLKYQQELYAVWYASPFIKRVCTSQPKWLHQLLADNELHKNCDANKYRKLLQPIIVTADSVEILQQQLRQQRTAAFARIAWRDLQQYTTVEQTLHELSAFAEVCVQETLQWCFQWLQLRPHANEFIKTLQQNIVIFALGKLGGGELNFSSDIDIVIAYSDDNQFTQDESAKAIEFYLKVVQLFIKVLSEQTQDGFVFRVDTRLRPFGESGALVPSFLSIDLYFQTHGRDWERYAWMKARAIAGDVQHGEEFLQEITPFIYRRYLDYGAMQSLREMKALIDVKARQDSAKENLKIGFGGIREIEFIAQMFQLIYGGKDSSLRIRSTLKALQQLEKQGLLTEDWVSDLKTAYIFLRKAENVLQLRDDQQTHTLPIVEEQRSHYAFSIGMQHWQTFYAEYKKQINIVNNLYQSLLEADGEAKQDELNDNEFRKIWLQIDDAEYCLNVLNKHFAESAQLIYEHLNNFSQSSRVKKLVPIARTRLDRLMPIFLHQLQGIEEPLAVFDRFLNILKKIVQRSTYISLLIENKNKLSSIFMLIQASPWVSQYLAMYPLLLDEVLRMDKTYKPPSMDEMNQQLVASLASAEMGLEEYMGSLREFKHSQVIQIAAADVVENYPIMKVSDHLSWLAETCLRSALEYAYRELVEKYGKPKSVLDNQAYTPEVLIIEYGKLGGLELGYGSDLDIVFLHNSEGSFCETSGIEKGVGKIHNEVFFTRLVQRTIHILTTVMAGGRVFEIDLRLRPHGESGPVISSISAYENYLMNDAWMWELQALVRARAVTASKKMHEKFESIRRKVLSQARNKNDVQAAIIEMRNKMLSANEKKSSDEFNIKKDEGGVIDIEFIVQFLVLSYSERYPQICEHTDNIRILDACAEVSLLGQKNAEELKQIYLKYRKHLHQLSLKLLPDIVDSKVFSKERSVVQNYWASLLHSGPT